MSELSQSGQGDSRDYSRLETDLGWVLLLLILVVGGGLCTAAWWVIFK